MPQCALSVRPSGRISVHKPEGYHVCDSVKCSFTSDPPRPPIFHPSPWTVAGHNCKIIRRNYRRLPPPPTATPSKAANQMSSAPNDTYYNYNFGNDTKSPVKMSGKNMSNIIRSKYYNCQWQSTPAPFGQVIEMGC